MWKFKATTLHYSLALNSVIIFILIGKWGTKRSVGPHMASYEVLVIWFLRFQWFGKNQKITQQNVISVWQTQQKSYLNLNVPWNTVFFLLQWPIPSEDIAVPESPRQIITSGDISETNAISQEEDENSIYNDPNFQASTFSPEFDLLTQEELDDLVSDLNMFKKQTELLESS
jgi:hypothetical protein